MNDWSGKRLAVFGDSIMFGSGNHGVGVGEFLRDKYGFGLYKYCIGGARVGYYEGKSWMVDQVKQAVKDGIRPDIILFDGFTNDCYKTDGEHFDVPLGKRGGAKPLEEITKADNFSVCFESIVKAFSDIFPGAAVVFVRPHRMGRREDGAQRDYGDRAAEICRDYGVTVADIYGKSGLDTFDPSMRDAFTCDSYGWGRGDATHPNEEGYRRFYLPILCEEIEKITKG